MFCQTDKKCKPSIKNNVKRFDIASKSDVIGNNVIEILVHDLLINENAGIYECKGINISLKNISGSIIGKITIRSILYDNAGNIIDTIETSTKFLQKDVKRTLLIKPSKIITSDIKSYSIKILKIIMTPVPVVYGNDEVIILKHALREIETSWANPGTESRISYIDISIRNISGKNIATAVFEALFYDAEGNILRKQVHKELDLKSNTSRAIFISAEDIDAKSVKSYKVTLIKIITADIEKIQLCRHEIRTTETGDEEVQGIIKNISDVTTDAALIATFKDHQGEKIGVKVLQIKDMYLGELRKFHFIFTPPEGVKVKTYSLDIGEMIEQPDIE